MSNNYRWNKLEDKNNLIEMLNGFLFMRKEMYKWDARISNLYRGFIIFINCFFCFFPFFGILYYFSFTKKWLWMSKFIKSNVLSWCPDEDRYFWQELLNFYKRINIITWIPFPALITFYYFLCKFYNVFSYGKTFLIQKIPNDNLAFLEKGYIVLSKNKKKIKFLFIECLSKYINDLEQVIKNIDQ